MKAVCIMVCAGLLLPAFTHPAFADWSEINNFTECWLCGGVCGYDLNDDSIVNFVDYALLIDRDFDKSLVANIDFVGKRNCINGDTLSFVRSGIAINRDGSEAADGEMRTDYITVASPLEISTVGTYMALACDADYVYAYDGVDLYRSRCAEYGWHLLYTFGNTAGSGFVTSEGTLLITLGRSLGKGGEVWRYANDTFTKVIADTVLTTNAAVASWGWSECDRRIFITEYRSSMDSNNARCVWMSNDDGLTWTKIHNPTNVTGRHAHHLVACYVDAAARVYICYGDTDKYAMFRLDEPNDGTDTWPATEITMPIASHPTAGFWSPELNAIIWGTDGIRKPKGFIKHNLSDDSMEFVQRMEIQRAGSNVYNLLFNVLSMEKYSTIYTVATANGASGEDAHEHSGVWVSQDYTNWAFAAQHNDTVMRIAGIGPQGNLWVRTATGSIYFPVTKPLRLEGALIERAGDQKSDNVPTAHEPTKVDNNYSTDKWTGSVCTRFQPDDTVITADDYVNYGNEVIPFVAAGDLVIAHFRVKGTIGDGNGNNLGEAKTRWCRALLQVRDANYENEDWICMQFYVDSGGWQHVVVPIVSTHTHETASSRARLSLNVMANADPEDAQFDILFDGVTIEKCICPAEWHDNGTDRNADVLSYAPISFPLAFADIFTVASRFGDFDMAAASSGDAASYIYIRSYVVDNDNFFAVVYDVYDKKFKLVDEVDGSNSVVIALANADYLFRDTAVVIAVTRDGTSANLYLWNRGHYQTGSGTITDHTIDRSYWGCHPVGTQGGSLIFVKNKTWNEAKSEADVKTAMHRL